jgi:DNA polymerase-3 subunit alpha
VGEKRIRFGLSAIKNVGQAVVADIITAREQGGPFQDIADLCARVESRGLNKKLLESLVKCGACDAFGPNRAELLAQIDGAMAQANARARDRKDGQGSLLDLLGPVESAAKANPAKSSTIADFSLQERLAYEKELLGFYISGHPLDDYTAEVAAFSVNTIAQIKEWPNVNDTRVCGIVTKVEIRTRQEDKKPWARIQLAGPDGLEMETLVFSDTYAALTRPLAANDVVIISGSVDRRDEAPKLRAAQVLWLDEAYEQLLQQVVLHLPLEDWLDPARWAHLRELVMDSPGPVKLRLVCTRANGGGERARVELAPADHYGIAWTPEMKAKLEGFLGGPNYELRANPQIARQKRRVWEKRAA